MGNEPYRYDRCVTSPADLAALAGDLRVLRFGIAGNGEPLPGPRIITVPDAGQARAAARRPSDNPFQRQRFGLPAGFALPQVRDAPGIA
jgi:hypothetical protein